MATNPYDQFDAATANPYDQFDTRAPATSSGVPGPRRTWSQTGVEALKNAPSSAAKFVGGVYEAVTSPVQTLKGLADVAAGGLQNVLPRAVKEFVDQFDASPDAAKRAVDAANAFGGFYKDRYGDVDKLKNTLATDPVGAAADLSTLLTGGAAATTRAAPTVSKVLGTAAKVVDPLTLPVKAVGATVRGGATAIGNALDLAQGNRPSIRAGEIVRQAISEEGRRPSNVAVTRAALTQASPSVTGRQAAAPAQAPQLQALGALIEERAPGISGVTQEAQEAGRIGTLTAVTPDEAAAILRRTQATEPLYQAAKTVEVPLDPAMKALIDRLPSQVLNKAEELARIEDRPFMLQAPAPAPIVSATGQPLTQAAPARVTGETLHYIKRGLDDILSATGEKALTKDLKRSVAQLRQEYLTAVDQRIPVYGQARQKFAQLSPEVNQAQVLNKLRETLETPLEVGQRPQAFATAAGKGEAALLKKATGQPRFTELSDVLTPEQLQAVSTVKGELTREADIAQQATRGRRAMEMILEANQYGFKLPGLFSAKIQLTNDTLALLQGSLNKKVLAELEKGFQSGKNLNDLIGKVPAKDRVEVLRALGEASTKLSSAKPTAAAQFQATQEQPRRNRNALAPESENVNALAP